MNRNYIRADALSFSSIELYMLFFLLISFGYILLKFKGSLSMKLICMYLLALPYTDKVYRLGGGVQISEILIFFIIINDVTKKKMKLSKNPLCYFMIGFSLILCMSTMFSIVQGVYNNRVYGDNLTPINSILNNFKFLMLIYVVNKIVTEVNTKEKLNLVLRMIRVSGNITAFTTIMQAVMYKLGFVVPGIFEMWGIPRAKGLSHEPATNAFVLLITIAISTFYIAERKCIVYKKSLFFQLIAFIICFSSGAIPLLFAYGFIYLLFLKKEARITNNMIWKGILSLLVLLCIGIVFFKTEAITETIGKLTQKVSDIFSDYKNGTDFSGRGSDIQGIKTVMKYNAILGIGSFNSTIFFKDNANTNTYLVLLMELGIGGILFLVSWLIFYIRYFTKEMRKIKNKILYANEMAFFTIVFIAIAWLRILFFHQIWVVFAIGFAAINLNKNKIKDTEIKKIAQRDMIDSIVCIGEH